MKSTKGMTLIELMVVLVIFSIVMMGLYSSSSVLLRQGVKEYRIAESEMELGISSNVLARDMSMAGFGLAEDYSAATGFTIPRSVSASNGASGVPDTLTLMGTAIGLESRAAQGWSYMSAYDIGAGLPTFTSWNDAREDVRADPGKNDVVIMMDPSTKRLRVQGTDWLFRFNGLNANLTTLSGAT